MDKAVFNWLLGFAYVMPVILLAASTIVNKFPFASHLWENKAPLPYTELLEKQPKATSQDAGRDGGSKRQGLEGHHHGHRRGNEGSSGEELNLSA